MVSRLRPGDPTHVGRYEVLGRIGGGGMGMVYLAEGPRGTVALKLVRPELGDDPHFRARFRREVQSSFRVSGVCTVRLLDFDTEADQPWMATEYVDGPSLTELIEAGGPLPPAKQLALAVGLAEGLKSIHEQDVVHRDLKPSNVLCAATGPKIIDFGIAAAADAAPITRSGLMVGSPGWLSPEQITTGRATAASDVFALGCILVYAAGGEQPFGTGTAEALFYRVLNQGPSIDFEKLAPALHDLVVQATAPDPAQRPSARAMLEALLDAGAVPGDVRGNTGSSVTSVLQRDWSLPSGLQISNPGSDSGTHAPAGAPAVAAAAAGTPAAAFAGDGGTGGGAPKFTKSPPPAPPPPPFPPPFTQPGPWTPPPGRNAPGQPPTGAPAAAYGPPPPQYSPTPPPGVPIQGFGAQTPPPVPQQGFAPPSFPPTPTTGLSGPGGTRRRPWLIPALAGGGVLAVVVILVVALVAGSGGSRGGTPSNAGPPVVAKDPNRIRSDAEVTALSKAASLTVADLPGYKAGDQSEPAGLLMPCGLDLLDFPTGAKQTGLDFQDANSNYTDERLSVSSDPAKAKDFFALIKSQINGCDDYTDDSNKSVKISAKDTAWAQGDEAVYVNEVKGSVNLSWGYMRRGPAVVLVSTINDIDQKDAIGQNLTRISDRITAAD